MYMHLYALFSQQSKKQLYKLQIRLDRFKIERGVFFCAFAVSSRVTHNSIFSIWSVNAYYEYFVHKIPINLYGTSHQK